jgi:hypothetical protein
MTTPRPDAIDGLICFWDFSEAPGSRRVSKTSHTYALTEMTGPVERVTGGPFGHAAKFVGGNWLNLPAKDCPALNFGGADGQVSVVAWLKRGKKQVPECQAVAGRWNETDKGRQYCLFLDLRIWDSKDQVGGHVSNIGGPTPGYKYCMDAAIGATPVPLDVWTCCAMTYANGVATAYLDGRFDERRERNPYAYPGGLFDGNPVSDFTVGGVFRGGSMGNWFVGDLGGLAIYRRALTDDEMRLLAPL